MEYRLLGPLEVLEAGRRVEVRGAKLRGLLVLLALDAGRVVSADRLIVALYGDELPQRAANALQQLVSKLRRTLTDGGGDGDRVVTRPPGYLLDEPPERVDALRFEHLLADSRRAATAGEPARASHLLGEALRLWRGDALADTALESDVTAVRTRLDELRHTAAEDRVDAELAQGHHDALVAELEAMVTATPLRERRWGQLMVALYRAGRQAEALRAYQQARRILGDELGVEPGPELRRLETAVLAHDHTLTAPTTTPPTAAPAPPHEQPTPKRIRQPLTSCLGRETELARLDQLVDGPRLITLVGPGGAGKTRLATELALTLDGRLADGVWWVELAPVLGDGVAAAVSRALGLDEAAPGATDSGALGAALQRRQAAIVFDNCEHVVDEVAVLVEELLGQAPDVRILATSREGLGVPGEVLFPVGPLAPTAAVDLFAERAAAAGLTPTPDDLAPDGPVADICRRLDGLPLAVELAAARARHMGITEIAGRLDQRFELLTGGPRTAQARQRTLRAVVDWSYGLLDEPERLVFDRLGVFAGSASVAAATHVCAEGAVAPEAVAALLVRLVDKSLVVVDRGGDTARYRLLQTLADYAQERLRERGEERATRLRHAEWIRDLAATVEVHADVADRRAQVVAVMGEDPEVRHALAWALAAEPVLAVDIAARLGFFWMATLHAQTGWGYLSAALDAAPDAPADLRAKAQAFAGVTGGMAGAGAAAVAHSDAAVEYERRHGDPLRLGMACFAKGSELMLRAQARAAAEWLEEARRCFGGAGDERGLAFTSYAQGFAASVVGDLPTAQAHLEDAEAAFQRQGEYLGMVGTLLAGGDLARRAGRIDDAAAAFEQVQALGVGTAVVTMAGATLALLRIAQDRLDEGRALAEQAVAESREGFSPVVAARALHARGEVRLVDGDLDGARDDLGRAAMFYGDTGLHAAVAMCRIGLSRVAERDGDLDGARAHAEAAVAEARRNDLVFAEVDACRRLAEVADLLGDAETASSTRTRIEEIGALSSSDSVTTAPSEHRSGR